MIKGPSDPTTTTSTSTTFERERPGSQLSWTLLLPSSARNKNISVIFASTKL